MTIAQMNCPKCSGKLVQGFVPDYTHQHALVEGWHEGQPKKSFWRHTKAPRNQGVPIGAFRCEKCGYLELYADPKFAAQYEQDSTSLVKMDRAQSVEIEPRRCGFC